MLIKDVFYRDLGKRLDEIFEFKLTASYGIVFTIDGDIEYDPEECASVHRWCEEHFGPSAILPQDGSRFFFDIDIDKRWAVIYWPDFDYYFRDVVDATHFKMRWG